MPNVIVDIHITMNERGQIEVTGVPLGQLMLFYGLLEQARDLGQELNKQHESRVHPAGPADISQFAKRGS